MDPRSLSRCSQVSWYWKWLAESDELWKPKCLRFGWVPPYKPSQFEHGAWKHFYILKVAESGVKLIPKGMDKLSPPRPNALRRIVDRLLMSGKNISHRTQQIL